ncbi:MAG: hypothetical protein Kow0080_17070 [Candidatus Promineifilaceae bacterium]
MAEHGEPLSDRELEVLKCVIDGLSNKEIAATLHISQNTVKVHLRNVYTKLGVTSRTEATTTALQQGLMTLPGTEALAQPVEPEATVDEPQTAVTQPSPETPPLTATEPTKRSIQSLMIYIVLGIIIVGLLGFIGWQAINPPNPTPLPTATPFAERPLGQSPWSETAPLETAAAGMAVAAVGLDVYQIGGETEAGVVNSVYVFDTQQNQWHKAPQKPTAVTNASAAVLFGEIIVAGGQLTDGSLSNIVEAYSPSQQAWRQLTPLPQPITGGLALSDGSFLYYIGGQSENRVLDTTYLYDPGADSWRPLTPLPTPRAFAAGSVIANKLYVVGGENEDGTLDVCEFYDPVAEIWQSCTPMLQPRTKASAAVVVNKLYVIGGNVSSDSTLTYSEIYDPNTDTWQVLNMPDFPDKRPWQQPGTANVETRIYILGGRRGDQLLNTHYIYTPFIYNTYIPAAAAEDQNK